MFQRNNSRAIVAFAVLFFAVGSATSGCSSSGTTSSTPADDEEDDSAEITGLISKALSGRVAKGPILDGTVEVYILDENHEPTELIGTGTTADDGSFDVTIEYPEDYDPETTPLEIDVYGGSYIDESTGEETVRADDDVLRSWISAVEEDETEVGVSLLTDAAVTTAESRLDALGEEEFDPALIQQYIEETFEFYSEAFGFDPRIAPADIEALADLDPESAEAKYAVALAGFTQLASTYAMPPRDFATLYASDGLDGSFDGAIFGEAITVAVNGVPTAYADSNTNPMALLEQSFDLWYNYSPYAAEITAEWGHGIEDFAFEFVAAPEAATEFEFTAMYESEYFTEWRDDFANRHSDYVAFEENFMGATAAEAGVFVGSDGTDYFTGAVYVYSPGCDPVNFDATLCYQSQAAEYGGDNLGYLPASVPTFDLTCAPEDGCAAENDGAAFITYLIPGECEYATSGWAYFQAYATGTLDCDGTGCTGSASSWSDYYAFWYSDQEWFSDSEVSNIWPGVYSVVTMLSLNGEWDAAAPTSFRDPLSAGSIQNCAQVNFDASVDAVSIDNSAAAFEAITESTSFSDAHDYYTDAGSMIGESGGEFANREYYSYTEDHVYETITGGGGGEYGSLDEYLDAYGDEGFVDQFGGDYYAGYGGGGSYSGEEFNYDDMFSHYDDAYGQIYDTTEELEEGGYLGHEYPDAEDYGGDYYGGGGGGAYDYGEYGGGGYGEYEGYGGGY